MKILNQKPFETIVVMVQNEKATITRETIIKEKEVKIEWFLFHATGYSQNDKVQGTTDIMYSGRRVYWGAVATDPEILPLGSRIEIRDLGIFICEDTGELIKGNKIDIFCLSKEEALKIHKDVWVRIIK